MFVLYVTCMCFQEIIIMPNLNVSLFLFNHTLNIYFESFSTI